MNKLIQNGLWVLLALLGSFVIVFFFQEDNTEKYGQIVYSAIDTRDAIFPQEVETVSSTPVEITKLYRENQLIGIVGDATRLDELFNQVYETEYKADFPDSKLGLIDDLYQTTELSYNIYVNRDEDIFNYIYSEDLFAIEVDKITFSNGAIIYVKDISNFNDATDAFIRNFISDEAYNAFKNNEALPALVDYGTRDIEVNVLETIQRSKGLASKDDILTTEAEVLTFLSYGYEPEMETHVVQQYETVAGVGWYYGMTANQVASINSDVIKDVNQVLQEGMELNVSQFNSPFTVVVKRERMTSEVVYPGSTIYVSDETLREGVSVVDTYEENGSRDVIYEDIYENGVAVSSTEVSSTVTQEPVRGVVRVGTMVIPRVGSGTFRWPMNNAYILCGWFCYANHRGVDFAAYGGGYGPIYAADRGVVSANSYDSGWGYYIRIDHNNGYQTLYAHMNAPGYYSVGTVVAKGDQIGYVGMTGRTNYPHVHFELYSGGGRINPCGVMQC